MMMGRMTDGKGGIKESREDEDIWQKSVCRLRTHSWCSHGDPRDDHLGDAFNCCFLGVRDTTRGSVCKTLSNICQFQITDCRMAQLVAIFICHCDAIQDFPEKHRIHVNKYKLRPAAEV